MLEKTLNIPSFVASANAGIRNYARIAASRLPGKNNCLRQFSFKAFFPRPVFLSLALGIANPAAAKDYRVDLLIFENLTSVTASDFSKSLYYPLSRNAISLSDNLATKYGFRKTRKNPTMNSVAARLDASERYNIIQHLSWQQPGLAPKQARAVKLNYGEQVSLYLPNDAVAENGLLKAIEPGTSVDPALVESVASTRLSGSVTLSLGKYLHLDTNLVLINHNGSGSTRMQLHRRMRSKEIHYLDNPLFGLIVLVVPVE